MMKTWEELSPLEQAHATWWDMYKDAHGIRPRGIDTSLWSLEDFRLEMQQLEGAIARAIEQDKLDEAKAIQEVEARITALALSTGRTREQAISLIAEREGTGRDMDHLCWLLGLPYKYFEKNA